MIETLPSNIIVYGSDSQRRLWTGVGVEQQKALYEKHLTYLLEILVSHFPYSTSSPQTAAV